MLARLLSSGVLPVALGAGILLEWAWPGDFGYRPARRAGRRCRSGSRLGGALVAVVAAVALRERLPTLERTDWVPAAACALFVVPLVVTGGW